MPNTQSLPPKVGHILRLAEIIREVDGNHDKGAAALAEAILSHPNIGAALAAEPQGPTDEELGDLLWEFTTSTGHGERLDARGFVRAAVARWGRQT